MGINILISPLHCGGVARATEQQEKYGEVEQQRADPHVKFGPEGKLNPMACSLFSHPASLGALQSRPWASGP
jgi:hypothetical protein